MTDAELVDRLQQKGADVGPVTGMFCGIELKAQCLTASYSWKEVSSWLPYK